ncbi:MAG: hypothetical protein ACYCZY_06795 [Lacisediminihabitans sp.]
MWFRRTLYFIQFGAVLILPLWVLAGRGLFGVYLGWHFVIQWFICPLGFLVLLTGLLLTLARNGVRQERAVSRLDALVLPAVYFFALAYGFFIIDAPISGERGSSVFTLIFGLDLNVVSYTIANTVGPLAGVIALAAVWLALRQLPQESRARIRARLLGAGSILRSAK